MLDPQNKHNVHACKINATIMAICEKMLGDCLYTKIEPLNNFLLYDIYILGCVLWSTYIRKVPDPFLAHGRLYIARAKDL